MLQPCTEHTIILEVPPEILNSVSKEGSQLAVSYNLNLPTLLGSSFSYNLTRLILNTTRTAVSRIHHSPSLFRTPLIFLHHTTEAVC